MLYIFWFLHQTTTGFLLLRLLECCISFDSYIKPQPSLRYTMMMRVVYLLIPTSNHNHELRTHAPFHVIYLLIPTSNHNSWHRLVWRQHVVYLLNPTSNHNVYAKHLYMLALYIFWFLHQTTTFCRNCHKSPLLYIFWILHQTTTAMLPSPTRERCISFESYIKPQPTCCCNLATVCCISFESYIKPQPVVVHLTINFIVYLLNPTSNHNTENFFQDNKELYIFWILHQTTT